MLVRVSRPRSTRQFSGLFLPQQGIVSMFFSGVGASRSQHHLSSFLLTKDGSRGCNAVGCANTNEHRPTNTRISFSAPEAVLSEVEQRFDCVQAQTHIQYIRVWWGVENACEVNFIATFYFPSVFCLRLF